MYRKYSILALFIITTIRIFAASTLTLEHTFDGYYFPYNIPVYLSSEDDRYFYCPMISADDGYISLKTYNEDYSLRDNYNVHFTTPTNYRVSAISFSAQFKLPDSTPFFIVIFTSTSIPYGQPDYTIANVYDARNGNYIASLGSASGIIQIIGGVYIINSKLSLCVLYGNSSTYTTKIFSLGQVAATPNVAADNSSNSPAPIFIYDMNGRLVNHTTAGQPFIEVMPDGSSTVKINH